MFKKILKGIGLLIVLTFVFLIVTDFTATTEYDKLDEYDKKMFESLSKVYKEFKENPDKIWNESYDMSEVPLMLVRTRKNNAMLWSHSYLINVEGADKMFNCKKMNMDPALGLPDVYRLGKLTLASKHNIFPANFTTTTINDTKLMSFKYNPVMLDNTTPWTAFPSFMVHEATHTYLQKDWTYTDNGAEHIDNYPFNAEQIALIGVEFDLLDQGLASESVDDVLKDLAIIRAYRYGKWPELIGEAYSEASEGTASYVEDMVSIRLGKITNLNASAETMEQLSFNKVFSMILEDKVSIDHLKRRASYDRGNALGRILDKTEIDWKSQINHSQADGGKTFDKILQGAFNTEAMDIESEIERIKTSSDYNTYFKKLEDLLKKY